MSFLILIMPGLLIINMLKQVMIAHFYYDFLPDPAGSIGWDMLNFKKGLPLQRIWTFMNISHRS